MVHRKTKSVSKKKVKKSKTTPRTRSQRAQRRSQNVQRTSQNVQRTSQKASIEFCKKCGSIMLPEKKGKSVQLRCRSCHYVLKKPAKRIRITGRPKEDSKVIVLESDTSYLPVTDQICEECGNKKAYWWLQQTRSADEPPTQFFRCTKCKHTWREYK